MLGLEISERTLEDDGAESETQPAAAIRRTPVHRSKIDPIDIAVPFSSD
jgi:hypothetical protein